MSWTIALGDVSLITRSLSVSRKIIRIKRFDPIPLAADTGFIIAVKCTNNALCVCVEPPVASSYLVRDSTMKNGAGRR